METSATKKPAAWFVGAWFVGGFLVSAFAGRLPTDIQDLGLYAGLVAMTGSGVGFLLYATRETRSRGLSMWPVLGMIVCACGLVGCLVWYHKQVAAHADATAPHVADAVKNPDVLRPEVSQSQFAELTQLSKFIGADENELRQTFDIMAVLKKNVAVNGIRIQLRKAGRQGEFMWNQYTEGDGSWIFIAMPGKFQLTPSGVHVTDGPNDVCYLVTTKRYQEAQHTLGGFLNSMLVPESIKAPLKDYKSAIDTDFEQMAYLLDKFMKQDANYFLRSEDYGSPYYGVIQSAYFGTQFLQLKPKADAVSREMAKYLKTS